MLYLPGDGRIWGRSISISSIHPNMFGEMSPCPTEYQHSHPDITAMQKQVLATMVYNESDTIGRPLTSQEAWRVINETENLL